MEVRASVIQSTIPEPAHLTRLQIPGRVSPGLASARASDRRLLAAAPANFLDTTHFDTVRFPPPPWAAAAFAEAASRGENAYSPYRGHPEVLECLADSIGAFLGVRIDATQNLIITPGTQAGLFAALGSVVEKGARVALLNPEYLFSERILQFYGANVATVRLEFDGPDGPSPDMDALEHEFAHHGTRLLVFSHPNNPSGAVFSSSTIKSIAALCNTHGVTVLIDELYSRLLHEGLSFHHLANQPGMFDRTITLLGPSKTESLSGYRLGVVVAPRLIVDRIENIQSIVSLRAPAYAQHLLKHWLRHDRSWLEERIKEFTRLRELTETKFKQVPWLKWVPGGGTAYAWPDVSALKLPAFEIASALLSEASVLVSPGYQFGPSNEGRFRVCYARDESSWSEALERMVEVFLGLAQARGPS